jgi:hypothetical protein
MPERFLSLVNVKPLWSEVLDPKGVHARIGKLSDLDLSPNQIRRGRRPAVRGPRLGCGLSQYAIAAGRLSLPASTDLLGLRGPGPRPFRAVGGRLDDAGAAVPLPTLRHLRARCGGGQPSARCALVRALALRALARHQSGATAACGRIDAALTFDLPFPVVYARPAWRIRASIADRRNPEDHPNPSGHAYLHS